MLEHLTARFPGREDGGPEHLRMAVLVAMERPDIMRRCHAGGAVRGHRRVGRIHLGRDVLRQHEDAAEERQFVIGQAEGRIRTQVITDGLQRIRIGEAARTFAVNDRSTGSRRQGLGHRHLIQVSEAEVGTQRRQDPTQDVRRDSGRDEPFGRGHDQRNAALDEDPDQRREFGIQHAPAHEFDDGRRLAGHGGFRQRSAEVGQFHHASVAERRLRCA